MAQPRCNQPLMLSINWEAESRGFPLFLRAEGKGQGAKGKEQRVERHGSSSLVFLCLALAWGPLCLARCLGPTRDPDASGY